MFAMRALGRSGLHVGALGISASYGVPAAAVEAAVEGGMTYVDWGSMRRPTFGGAIRALAARRVPFTLVLQSYSPFGWCLVSSVERALRRLGLDRADVLLLGMWNRRPPPRIIDACESLRSRGLIRTVAVSTHRRPLVAEMAASPGIDIFHVRYNAVHSGAERDVFPHLPADGRPGIVAFTATSWKQLDRKSVV